MPGYTPLTLCAFKATSQSSTTTGLRDHSGERHGVSGPESPSAVSKADEAFVTILPYLVDDTSGRRPVLLEESGDRETSEKMENK